MAVPAMYAQQQMKGTLMSGQMIAVNKYTVQVEKFLSQGGFAHVYLVRTAEQVFNTTHHVLKRIAVANEAMLNDVKKEVDIMRILKGHPNIVYLIDAAWHKMPNGMFEVFILMEFCQGGGIIDMMNRRLRERLTEAEILQIFVDVCEGVAAMHNLRPSLLHRDLKVENILQASATSYKLCDFGSAMPVASRPPSTTAEIKALEADLNKHTTLQYRAPEMVDVYQRRPVDEKSDVWALGVLLYKLCYYTTPFEEHGVLAILNVQYRFPPYPVYSQQLNGLITSMLREHNVHRPSVFELLETVHAMRGTKSRFSYNPPPPQPLSPRKVPQLPPRSQEAHSKVSHTTSPPQGGIQAREKVLEAIAPMRRGRPTSPTRAPTMSENTFGLIDATERGPWAGKPAKAHKSGLAAVSMAKSPPSQIYLNDAWALRGARADQKIGVSPPSGFTDSFEGHSDAHVNAARPALPRNNSSFRPQGGDAFDSLNVLPSPRPQSLTLGEAQKAAQSSASTSTSPHLPPRPTPSPSYKSPSPVPTGLKTGASQTSWSKAKVDEDSLSAEQRFPSLEDLDAGAMGTLPASGSVSAPPAQTTLSPPPQPPQRPVPRQDPSNSLYHSSVASALGTELKGITTQQSRTEGVRSQQVTGTAMRDARKLYGQSIIQPKSLTSTEKPTTVQYRPKSRDKSREKLHAPSRPMLTRKHRSSISLKQNRNSPIKRGFQEHSPSPTESTIAGLPPASGPPMDWLTGDASELMLDNSVKLRASPEKRASLLQSPGLADVSRQASFREMASSPTKRGSGLLSKTQVVDTKAGKHTSGLPPVSPKSSSEDEGPEDVDGSLRQNKGADAVGDNARQRIMRKGRQGSVHDLVDLWGGGSASQSPKPSPSIHEKHSSTLAAPVLSTRMGSEKQRTSPSTSPSTSRLIDNSSPSKTASGLARKASVTGRQTTVITPKPISGAKPMPTSPTPNGGRSRPQSMFLPVQKSISETTPSSIAKPVGLVPPNKPRMQQRRSSISDLVSHYEAIDNQTQNVPAPNSPLLSSADLISPSRSSRIGNIARSPSSTSLTSPTATSSRFPRISPTNSPRIATKALGGNSLDLPERVSPSKFNPPSRRASPAPSFRSPSPVAPSPSYKVFSQTQARQEEVRASPAPKIATPVPSRPGKASLSALLAKDSVGQESKADIRDPSPEKPYQGVGKLIAQWQTKTSDGSDGSSTRGAMQGSLKNTNSRFRTGGIQAGGKTG